MPGLISDDGVPLPIGPLRTFIVDDMLGPLYLGVYCRFRSIIDLPDNRVLFLAIVIFAAWVIIVSSMFHDLFCAALRLFGVSTVQAVLYYQHSKEDHMLLKCVVRHLYSTMTSSLTVDAGLRIMVLYFEPCQFPAALNEYA